MKMPSVRSNREDGVAEIDWNKVVDLCTKLAGIAGIVVSVWAMQKGFNTETKVERVKQATEDNRSVMDVQYSPAYVEQVIETRNQNKAQETK